MLGHGGKKFTHRTYFASQSVGMFSSLAPTHSLSGRLPEPVRRMSTTDQRSNKIDRIAACPAALRKAVESLSDSQLDTPYRDGGWTVRQVVHHLADSHANAYLRCKWVASENGTTLKTYDQDAWAAFADSTIPIACSLTMLDGLHERWTAFLRTVPQHSWSYRAIHPERGEISLDDLLDIYSDHGENHVKQITDLRAGKGW